MGPLQRYQNDLEHAGFEPDEAQHRAVLALQDVWQRLVFREQGQQLWPTKLRNYLLGVPQAECGLYLWGGVGRGKTYLMDTFFDALPFERKLRVHFHRFMQHVHGRLTELNGEKNPLLRVADELACDTAVICFDEFFVTDIADAMILAGLMDALFTRGVCLVATSNIEPKYLYKDGLQRSRFLPAIALIEQHTMVMNVDSGVDYRLRTLEQAALYYYPLGAAASGQLRERFEALTHSHRAEPAVLTVNHRPINVLAAREGVMWSSFETLCLLPRSPSDFIELAREFHTVLLQDVPCMTAGMEDAARRFITLIDEFYDRGVKLIISSECAIEGLYNGRLLCFEFQRTQSRLLEMQSHDYLAREHRP